MISIWLSLTKLKDRNTKKYVNANWYYKIERLPVSIKSFSSQTMFGHAYVCTRERIDSHRHRKLSTRIVTSQSMSQWSGRLVPGDSERATDEGRRGFSRIDATMVLRFRDWHIARQYCGCIVRRCHPRCRRRHRRSQQNVRKHPRALLPFHCRFDARCFTASFSVLPPMHSELYTLLSYTFGRSYSLFGCSPLYSPLVRAAFGSQWKCNSWCSRTKRVK